MWVYFGWEVLSRIFDKNFVLDIKLQNYLLAFAARKQGKTRGAIGFSLNLAKRFHKHR
jgi:hypothetical protein